mgnify:CR=1 FL=1
MKKLLILILALALVFAFAACTSEQPSSEEPAAEEPDTTETAPVEEASYPDLNGHTLSIYCGAGMTNPFQEIADAFQEQTGCEMEITYGNAGTIQTQINTTEEGDLFIAGSGDELKPVESYIAASVDLVKHIPVLAVQTGNPKNITGLSDLANEGVQLMIGDTESTPIGKIAMKALTDLGINDKVTLVATTATAPAMPTALAAGETDAIIVWKENCSVDGVEIVDTTDLDNYIKTVPAASLTCSDDPDALAAFLEFLASDSAKDIWQSYGYEICE